MNVFTLSYGRKGSSNELSPQTLPRIKKQPHTTKAIQLFISPIFLFLASAHNQQQSRQRKCKHKHSQATKTTSTLKETCLWHAQEQASPFILFQETTMSSVEGAKIATITQATEDSG
mmetsp:Transcript_17569/g.40818  ORF Transcript_17569/g.40818 Transcript_17569/m.40818 type:complete len:117 (+) Transcript_17569:108-458(+)